MELNWRLCLSECCLATALCVCVLGGGAGASEEKGAGLEDVVTLGRVQLRVVGVRHHAAVVLTVVPLSG